MLESSGLVVTVEHVRASLSWLVPSLATFRLLCINNKVSHGFLVKRLAQLWGATTFTDLIEQ